MFTDLIDYPIESDRLNWEARQVLRDLNQEPHLLIRVKLGGTYFPQRALEPFAVVGKVRSRFVEIADDGLSARAYFGEPLPEGGRIEFGYGEQILLRFPGAFDPGVVECLDPERLPEHTRRLGEFGEERS
jgi:hypothetical protein